MNMANIYLKLPWYVAAYYRGLDEDHQLTEFEPFVYCEYTHEYVVMANNLRYIPESRLSKLCYSQRAWDNILHGRTPEGDKKIMDRDPKAWPTTQELCAMTGAAATGRMLTADYLAIQMPREVFLNRRVHRTNNSYSFSSDVAQHFQKMLCQEFYHVFLDWTDQNERYAARMGIHRKNTEVMEMFLEQFNIPILDKKEQETLRRMRNRWLENARKRPNDRINFNSIWLDHVSDDERKRAEDYKKKYKK